MTKLSTDNELTIIRYSKHPQILKMKQYCQHGKTSTYDHCKNVMTKACNIAIKLNLSNTQINNIIIGSLLHDFYLYDYHGHRIRKEGIHAWTHATTALKNAETYFSLNSHQKNIIISHMFPTCINHPPKCIEAWIVTFVDKYCAIEEYINSMTKRKVPY